MAKTKVMTTYTTVASGPKKTSRSARIAGFRIGHQERNGSRKRCAALEETHEHGDGRAGAEGCHASKERAEDRILDLMRAREDTLDAFLRHPDLENRHQEANRDEERE